VKAKENEQKERYVLKKGYAKDLVVVAKKACQQASHNGLDVVQNDSPAAPPPIIHFTNSILPFLQNSPCPQ
jgi:hypothetical protein